MTDQRWPLKLSSAMALHQKEMMRFHLVAVQEIIAAMAARDFDTIAKAARSIGYSKQKAAICTNMGAATPGFTERAIAFHHSADKIALAAEKRNIDGVTAALAQTLEHCTSCHAMYRQDVVDQSTWQQLRKPTTQLP